MSLSVKLTVVALLNAMIGGTILVLPVLFMQAGILPSIIAILIMGFVNDLSCRICINHLGGDSDLPEAIDRHSNGQLIFGKLYNVLLFVGNAVTCMLYFQLIVIEWQILVGSESWLIPAINAVCLFGLILLLKHFQFGTQLLGYGIISIMSYLVFLVWVRASAPRGDDAIPLWTWNFNQILNALSTAFAIQGVFVPIMRKCQQRKAYGNIILMSFIIGGSVYTFIGFTGSFGIVTRLPQTKNPQTVQEYFPSRDWPVMMLAAIYLVHLYTALPQYLSIGKKRFLDLFGIQEKRHITWQDVAVTAFTMGLCFCIGLFKVHLTLLLAINGSLISFFSTYLIPVYIYVRCYYFPQSGGTVTKLIQVQIIPSVPSLSEGEKVSGVVDQKQTAPEEPEEKQDSNAYVSDQNQIVAQRLESEDCIKTGNSCWRKFMLGVNLVFLMFGVFVLAYTIYEWSNKL